MMTKVGLWKQQTCFEDQYREIVVTSLNTLIEKIGYDSANESIAALSAVGLLTIQDAGTCRKLADFYYSNQNWIGAIVNFNKCCVLNPLDFNAMFYLACAYKNLGCFGDAVGFYNKSLEIQEYPEAMLNLALTYSEMGEKELELPILERLTSAFPNFTLGHYNSGIFWYGKKDLVKSIQCYRNALETDPGHGPTKVALALALLMDKQYREGFMQYDSRWGVLPNCPIREFNRPYWCGQDVPAGSTILVTLEQGFGDTLQMLRYLPPLSKKFSNISIEVQPQMQRLVALLFPGVNVVVHGNVLPLTDYYCPIMSLPRAFETTYETIPAQRRYLTTPVDTHFNILLKNNNRKRIGVCWRGGMNDPRMVHRSLGFKSVKALFEDEAYAWVSLVKDLPDDERAEMNSTGVFDITSKLIDFYDTYRLISSIDLIVTVDTAVAHLAGAMGKPTIVILNDGYDWRWHVEDEFSAWYPNMRLLRAYKLNNDQDLVPKILEMINEYLN